MSIIFSDPVGSSQDQIFSYQDLMNVDLEFPQSTATYFSGDQQEIICINVPFQSGDQQCSVKAELWIPPAYQAVIIPPPPHCVVGCESVIPPIITPEPVYFGLVVGLLGAMLLVRRLVKATKL